MIFFGNKNSNVYQAEEQYGTVLSFAPTPALLESLGARVVVKGGERVVVKDLAEQGEKAVVKDAINGAAVVRIGAEGEEAVRKAYPIGDKVLIPVGDRNRIPDGLTPETLSEVKNVKSLSYTAQLRDFDAYAKAHHLDFDLYVRAPVDGVPATKLSRPLQDAVDSGEIELKFIPSR